jgi:hypothetical protein
VFMGSDGAVLARVNKMIEPDVMMRILGPAMKKLAANPTAAAAK